MASQFQVIFGDFTEEEHNCYLKEPACVEFPWELSDGLHEKDDGPVNSDWDACQPSKKDENQNHIVKKDWMNGPVTLPQQKPTDLVVQAENTKYLQVKAIDNMATQKRLSPDNDKGSEKDYQNSVDDNIKGQQALKHEKQKLSGKNSNESGDGPVVNGLIAEPDKLEEAASSRDANENIAAEDSSNFKQITLNDDSDTKNNIQENEVKATDNSGDETQPTIGKSGSWASLFSGNRQIPKPGQPIPYVAGAKSTTQVSNSSLNNGAAKKKHVTFNELPSKPESQTTVVNIGDDTFSKQIAVQIRKNEIVYRSPGLKPRGFINSSNWCYINATLQALLTCSPFCHLMRSFPSRQVPPDNNVLTSTPILDSFVRLVKELKPMSKRTNGQRKEHSYGVPYEPDYIYKMLTLIKSNLSERGRQEDAEEFLSCVLNGLHEEMLKLNDFYNDKLQSPQEPQGDAILNSPQTELGYEVPLHEDDPENDSNEDQEEQWEEVQATRKNRSSIMRRADISKTPISELFRGELRSDLYQDGHRATATLEPFFTLQLDINDPKTWSVNEALEHLTRRESVKDFTNSKTKAKVEANRQQTLETLPPILVLHLKRFLYDKTGGSLKLDKEIQYHTDLTIGKDLLSKPARKISTEKRSYKLFAVVYHHGKKSTGGHYTTDVYHDGLGCWLRIDDQHIKMTNVHEVVRHNAQRTAYLLYYKRTDLMSV